ncbi:hypothetical protein COO91_07855 [Nostoc flagelliforme CCNUN1]|uniref:Uncharacterized protein n=1 Tax=Nostoc flagelliforme CCNUN1 TaxID=2038116 RepID=A0A2K8T257_9NOSO|nr:hypothetical protein COO91_07855 [Nostoc flagelliforme CCNUN1]
MRLSGIGSCVILSHPQAIQEIFVPKNHPIHSVHWGASDTN